MIKAKYNEVIESITLDSSFSTAIGITPDGLVVFSGSPMSSKSFSFIYYKSRVLKNRVANY